MTDDASKEILAASLQLSAALVQLGAAMDVVGDDTEASTSVPFRLPIDLERMSTRIASARKAQ